MYGTGTVSLRISKKRKQQFDDHISQSGKESVLFPSRSTDADSSDFVVFRDVLKIICCL